MGIFSFFGKRREVPTWNGLSLEQRRNVMRKIKAMAGPRYRIVTGYDQTQREAGTVESGSEDQILSRDARGRLLDLTRNAMRNSSAFATIMKQFDLNVCGTKAGKAIFSFQDDDLNRTLKASFGKWTRCADFFDGFSFNSVLKLILKQILIGGDCVVLFDDRLIENSGKLVIYESDEIGDVPQDEVRNRYGSGSWSSHGKVYSRNGRWIGTIVSRACRGCQIFDPGKCFFLKRDPNESNFGSFWVQPSQFWRPGQGRGVSACAPALGTILDLEDLTGFELQAAKKNAQTFAQILHAGAQESAPSAFSTEQDLSKLSDEEIRQLADAEGEILQTMSFSRAQSCGIIYEQLPDGYKMELLDTKHPNDRTQDFVVWLAGRSSAVFGLSQSYATLQPGDNFRAQQLLSAPAFQECQKSLEQLCDWVLFRWVKWRGIELPDDFIDSVSWQWPGIDELDETSHQNAVAMKLRNLTGTLKEELGSDWKERLAQVKEEMAYCKQNGLPHPAMQMISGGMREEYENA
jgi:hypothetical protein